MEEIRQNRSKHRMYKKKSQPLQSLYKSVAFKWFISAVVIFVMQPHVFHVRAQISQIEERDIITSNQNEAQDGLSTSTRKKRSTRPVAEATFPESKGSELGKIVFQLELKDPGDTYKLRDENRWVEVHPNGKVRVKQKWDYEELGPWKTIEFWVTISNNARESGRLNMIFFPEINNRFEKC